MASIHVAGEKLVFRLTPARALLIVLSLGAMAAYAYRFAMGLGYATNLRDDFPWGIWIGFDMMTGVALAAGGFVMAFSVEVFGRHRFRRFVRPAIVTAFLGYLLAVFGLIGDLGLPWRIVHPVWMWNPRSVMFEVAWCVILYTTVLFLEFSAIPLERFKMTRLLSAVRKVMPVLIVLGIILSTLHQSSLGSLFLLMEHRLHPLWFSQFIPVHFLLTAIPVGFAMVIFESILSCRLLEHELDNILVGDLAKPLPWLLFIVFTVRMIDISANGAISTIGEGSLQSFSFLAEIGVGVLLPGILLFSGDVRYNPTKLLGAVSLVIFGVVLNRINVCIIGMFSPGSWYFPMWIELVITAGLVAAGVLAISFIYENMPVLSEEKRP